MSMIGKRLISGLLVPNALPEKIGFGCPICDDSLFVSPMVKEEDFAEFMAKFFVKHRGCGDLEILEKRGSDLVITGRLEKGNF